MLPEQDELIEQLYRAHFRSLLKYAMISVHDPHLAEELVQDAFHEAVNRIDQVMAHPEPKYWLRRTLHHKILHSQQRRARDLRRLISLDAVEVELAVDPNPLEEQVVEKLSPQPGVAEQLQAHLTPEELWHLKRLTLDKASHLEVAEELHISVWNSQKRLERIRKKLQKLFPNF